MTTVPTSARTFTKYDIIREFRRSRGGMAGVAILFGLILMSIYSAVAVPIESFRQWNNPNLWIDLPKTAAPAWTNIGFGPRVPEHIIMTAANDASISSSSQDGTRTVEIGRAHV